MGKFPQHIDTSSIKMKSNKIGKIAKIAVMYDLEKYGYDIFMDFTINRYGDFIVMPGKLIVRVKSARMKENGKPYYSRMSNHNYDILALVFSDGMIMYKEKADGRT